jgi:hypothetical protein
MNASGRLKPLGVSSLTRLPSLPAVPTIHKAVREMLATPALATRLVALGQTLAPAQMDVRAALVTELATWKKLFS